MQFVSSLLVECLNTFVVAGQQSIRGCVGNFVAVIVISEIDNIYISALNDPTLGRIQAADDFKPKIVYSQVNWLDRNKTNKCQFVFYRLVRGFYISFYFYFFPFVTLIISYAAIRCSEI